MTDITDARTLIQEEETRYRAPASESMFTRVGGAINHIMNRQYDTHSFFLNGRYTPGAGTVNLDGLYVFQFDVEVVAISFGNAVPGTTGNTTIDIHKLTGGGTDAGSIFTVKPAITTSAGADSYAAENYETATSVSPAGYTLPTLTSLNFDQFEALRLDLDSAMTGAENLFFNIHFRPR